MLTLIISVNLLVLSIDLIGFRMSSSRITNSQACSFAPMPLGSVLIGGERAALLLRQLVRARTSSLVPRPIGPVLPWPLAVTPTVDINTDLMVVQWPTLTMTLNYSLGLNIPH